ncbi:hypothetical protein [Flyfo podovirus Tbat2_2]|nr:hypothetical protein [Flyfo podovirus Tbat2_2]
MRKINVIDIFNPTKLRDWLMVHVVHSYEE